MSNADACNVHVCNALKGPYPWAMATDDAIRVREEVTVAPERAFQLFAQGLGGWWPAEYTWSGECLESICIEPFEDGRCYERGPHGFQCDWGRVLVWDPPRRLVFSWQIGPDRAPQPDPAKAGEVEVSFTATKSGGTAVELEHRGFASLDGGSAYREALSAEAGWPYILSRYVSVVARAGEHFPTPSEAEAAARMDDRLSGRGKRGSSGAREPGHLSTDELVEMVERASRRVRE